VTPARHLLIELRAHGVRVVVDGDALRLSGPCRPPESLLARVRAEKRALLRLLRPSPTPRPSPVAGAIVLRIADVFGPGCTVLTKTANTRAPARAIHGGTRRG